MSVSGSSIRDKVVGLKAAGVANHLIAEAAGVTPAHVNQLLEIPEVMQAIALERSKSLEQDLAVDKQIERIERAALDRVERMIPFAKVETAARVFSEMNRARKKAVSTDPNGASAGHVTIVLPAAAKVMIQTNAQNQVIEVEGSTIAPLPSRALPELAKRLEAPSVVQDVQPAHQREYVKKADLLDKGKQDRLLEIASRDITTIVNGVEIAI